MSCEAAPGAVSTPAARPQRTTAATALMLTSVTKLEPGRAVLANRPVRVVRDLPRMAFGVEEDARVAAPERLRPWPRDPSARGLRLGEHGVDLLRRAGVVGECDAAPAAGVLDDGVL